MDQMAALHRLQAEELDILLAIAEFCEKRDITWFMMSGTALGAARHQGFIPWDDDIDIGMLREDYDRFLELAETGLPEGYSLHTTKNTPGFAPLFSKVYRDGTEFRTAETAAAGCDQAIFVDVFPLDRVPADSVALSRLKRDAMLWQRLSYLYHSPVINVPHQGGLGAVERLACRIAHAVVRAAFSPERIRSRFEELVERRAPTGGGAGYLALSWPYVDPIARDVLIPPAMAAFEGHDLPVPAQLEKYLEIWYGDWRQLPPPEKRHTHLPERIVFSDGTRWEREG